MLTNDIVSFEPLGPVLFGWKKYLIWSFDSWDVGLDKACFSTKNINSFLIYSQKHMLWCSLEVPHWGASNEYPQHMFL